MTVSAGFTTKLIASDPLLPPYQPTQALAALLQLFNMSAPQNNPHATASASVTRTSLPTQAQFLEHGLEICTPVTLGLEDTICSIRTFVLTSDEMIVKRVPCNNCFFHEDCLKAWFTSTHERRGTCPNDQTLFFQPERVAFRNDELDLFGAGNLVQEAYDEAGNLIQENYDDTVQEDYDHTALDFGAVVATRLESLLDSLQERWIIEQDSPEERWSAEKVIEAWHAAEDDLTLPLLHYDIHSLRNEYTNASTAVIEQCQGLADEIEEQCTELRDRYIDNLKAWVQEHAITFTQRIQILKASNLLGARFLPRLEREVEKLVDDIESQDTTMLRNAFHDATRIGAQLSIWEKGTQSDIWRLIVSHVE